MATRMRGFRRSFPSATNNQRRAGKAPWTWDIIETRGVGARKVEELLNAYVERSVKQHDFEGGFDEATKKLVTTL